MTGDELIHDPTAHTDKLVLRPLTELGQLRAVYREARVLQQGVASGYFDRGRRTQARSERHVAANVQLRAPHSIAGPLKRHRDSLDVIAPMSLWPERRVNQVEISLLAE